MGIISKIQYGGYVVKYEYSPSFSVIQHTYFAFELFTKIDYELPIKVLEEGFFDDIQQDDFVNQGIKKFTFFKKDSSITIKQLTDRLTLEELVYLKAKRVPRS